MSNQHQWEEVVAMNIITDIFERMDNWRNLPGYQLERRADIFFGVYLNTVLEAKYDTKIKEEIIPEFPTHKATIYPTTQGHGSFKIDYLAFSEDNKIAFLIELKTDMESRRDQQDDYLSAVKKIEFAKLIEGLLKIFQASKTKRKYFHLFKMLEDAGIIELPSELQSKVFSKNMVGVSALIRKVKIITHIEQIKVVYIQPTDDDGNVISFNEFASLIEGIGDPFTKRFVESLRTWSAIKAGDINA